MRLRLSSCIYTLTPVQAVFDRLVDAHEYCPWNLEAALRTFLPVHRESSVQHKVITQNALQAECKVTMAVGRPTTQGSLVVLLPGYSLRAPARLRAQDHAQRASQRRTHLDNVCINEPPPQRKSQHSLHGAGEKRETCTREDDE